MCCFTFLFETLLASNSEGCASGVIWNLGTLKNVNLGMAGAAQTWNHTDLK